MWAKHRMSRQSLVVLSALLALPLGSMRCEQRCEPDAPVVLPEFLLGFSQTSSDVVSISLDVGVAYVRPTLAWRVLEPTVQIEGVTLAQVQNDAAVSAYIAGHDWSSFDSLLSSQVAAGLSPIPIVGHGFSNALPRLNGAPAAPDALGVAEYLARQYLVTRATVERYDGDGMDDAPGSPRVDIWQIENELNQAFLTGLFGWRDPAFFYAFVSSWGDLDFVTTLLQTLSEAVVDADSTALVTTNFHTDVHPDIDLPFGQPPWKSAVLLWRPYLDILGLDTYPNYYKSTPVRGAWVGERVAELRALACGRPVIVLETGYPTGPAERGYDEASQAAYLDAAFQSAVAAGASGFFWFGSRTSDVHSVVITQEDLDNLVLLGEAFETGDLAALLTFAIGNQAYIESHFNSVVKSVEPYWGIVRPDGTHKPAWDVLATIASNLPGLP